MADRPATSSVQHASAAYGHLLDLLDLPPSADHDGRRVEQALWFAECARELSAYQWDDLAEHLRYRFRARVQPEDDLPGPQEWETPVVRTAVPAPRPIRDDPQA